MPKAKKVFALYHIYDRTIDGIIFKESKRIGFFETEIQCKKQVSIYKKYRGFDKYPENCFTIFEYEIGQSYWRDELL